jgi:competence protein ComEC
MNSENFFGFTVGTAVGIVSEIRLGFGYPLAILSAFLGIVVLLLRFGVPAPKTRFLVPLLLFGCALGIIRVDVSQANRNTHALDRYIAHTVQYGGIISGEPDVRESYTNVVLEAKSVSENGMQSVLDDPTNILLRVPTYPELHYGDEVSVTGKVVVPQNFATAPGVRAFDYRAYLAKDDIYYEMPFSKISVSEHDKGNWLLGKLIATKYMLNENIGRAISEPESSLAGGIVLGTKQSLGPEWIQKFRDAGLAHIVVLSGYNIAVVASVIGRAVSFLPFIARLGFSALGIILFAMMVGGGTTVLRATLMALVVILARVMGRESDALRVLILVGWIMVLINPAILLSDVSFQLSFLAALALVVLASPLDKYFSFIKSGVLREIVVTTIATQIFVAPVLLYQMGNFSLVGFVANIFVLPIVPLAMLLVSIVSILGAVPVLGFAAALPTRFLLAYILKVVDVGSRASFANVHVASFGIIPLIISYGIIAVICIMLARTHKDFSKKNLGGREKNDAK